MNAFNTLRGDHTIDTRKKTILLPKLKTLSITTEEEVIPEECVFPEDHGLEFDALKALLQSRTKKHALSKLELSHLDWMNEGRYVVLEDLADHRRTSISWDGWFLATVQTAMRIMETSVLRVKGPMMMEKTNCKRRRLCRMHNPHGSFRHERPSHNCSVILCS